MNIVHLCPCFSVTDIPSSPSASCYTVIGHVGKAFLLHGNLLSAPNIKICPLGQQTYKNNTYFRAKNFKWSYIANILHIFSSVSKKNGTVSDWNMPDTTHKFTVMPL